MIAVLLLAFCNVSLKQEFVDRVDIIELNHTISYKLPNTTRVYGSFDYWIFWEWDGYRHRVVDWRSVKPGDLLLRRKKCLYLHPRREAYRRIMAGEVRETWTVSDPEVKDRYVFPKNWRRKLTPTVIPYELMEKD